MGITTLSENQCLERYSHVKKSVYQPCHFLRQNIRKWPFRSCYGTSLLLDKDLDLFGIPHTKRRLPDALISVKVTWDREDLRPPISSTLASSRQFLNASFLMCLRSLPFAKTTFSIAELLRCWQGFQLFPDCRNSNDRKEYFTSTFQNLFPGEIVKLVTSQERFDIGSSKYTQLQNIKYLCTGHEINTSMKSPII